MYRMNLLFDFIFLVYKHVGHGQERPPILQSILSATKPQAKSELCWAWFDLTEYEQIQVEASSIIFMPKLHSLEKQYDFGLDLELT